MSKKAKPDEPETINNEPPEETEQHETIDSIPPTKATLFERILWVRDRVTRLGKDANVGGKYKAITHDKVTASLRPKLVQAGIVSWMSCKKSANVETGGSTTGGKKIMQFQATFEITFINAYDAKDGIVIKQVAYADDYGDKAPGKAASYAMKYALLKLFMVETGEEDEERVGESEDDVRGSIIQDDNELLNEIWSLAEELFGDDANKMLTAMAQRRFFVETYGQIPQERYNDAIRSLRVGKKQLDDKEKEST